ncbi:MAG: NAD(P)H-dependent oxidoreductase [Desulfopila sp.]
MQAHIVIAHPEPKSFNHHLARVAKNELERQGWSVSLSDLYQKGFDPCERFSHYTNPIDSERFNVQAEQRNACQHAHIPPDVKEEIELLDAADLLLLQYPMWWHLPPAILKGWFDRVFIYGEVYTSKKRFEHGRFLGKQALLSVTVGTSRDTYAYNGRSGDIDMLLWPIHFNLAYVGYTVLQPFVAYGVEAGIQYSNQEIIERRLQEIPEDLVSYLRTLKDVQSIDFNTMNDWDSSGTITASAPAYSPFIRHNSDLDLG